MNRLICFLTLFFIISQPLFAQESGVPFAVDVSNRPTVRHPRFFHARLRTHPLFVQDG